MADETRALDAVRKIQKFFVGSGLSLSVAESCTGGLISHYLTTLPGASAFFKAAVVSYSEEMKKKLLGVSSEVISSHGVVSEQTAKDMAEKVRVLTGSDFSISSTGNLGPDVLENKKRGLIYISVSREGSTLTRELRLKGTREQNKEEAALEALTFLLEITGR